MLRGRGPIYFPQEDPSFKSSKFKQTMSEPSPWAVLTEPFFHQKTSLIRT